MPIRTLLFYRSNLKTSLLSYNDDWNDAFCHHSDFSVDSYNLEKMSWIKVLPFLRKYELIVCLHSTNSNGIYIPKILGEALKWRKGKLILFIGNEYKLIPEKITLLKELEVDLIVSQLPQDIAEWLYTDCTKSSILSLPHALNPNKFQPVIPQMERHIDIGARGFEYLWYLGDKERVDLFNFFQNGNAISNLRKDISFDPAQRFNREGWGGFLNSCKGTISTEAGSSYLERDDKIRKQVNAFKNEHPDTTFDEVYTLFFEKYDNPISGKCISSRNFDSIGTKTCQIMFPGRFNDILKADKHYIALNQDFSNIDDVLERFFDESYRTKLVDSTYEYVMDAHTHQHRIKQILSFFI